MGRGVEKCVGVWGTGAGEGRGVSGDVENCVGVWGNWGR